MVETVLAEETRLDMRESSDRLDMLVMLVVELMVRPDTSELSPTDTVLVRSDS